MHENYLKLRTMLDTQLPVRVRFTSKIEDLEAYPEHNMGATIRKMDFVPNAEGVLKIEFDYSEFDALNAPMESSNYYDADGNACLTAREANMYQLRETIYFDVDTDPFEYLTLMNEPKWTLESGRALHYNGVAVATLNRVCDKLTGNAPLSPAETDELAHKIVAALNILN